MLGMMADEKDHDLLRTAEVHALPLDPSGHETVPIDVVKKTYEELKRMGFPAVFNPIPKHTHDYYAMADAINYAAWEYLKDKRNESPEFTHYDRAKPK